MKLHLLGTGTPVLDESRPATTSFLVELEQETLLFDAGRGTTMQLLKQGFSPVDIDAIFITHHHYDHICDLGEVLLAAWHNGRTHPVHIFGPTGTAAIVNALFDQVFARDIAFARFREPKIRDIHKLFSVTEITGTWQYESGSWCISAEKVNHGNTLGLSEAEWLCLGYRLEANGKSLAIGGDAVACTGLSKLARNADALVISCYLTKEEVKQLDAEQLVRHVIASSGEVGKIAAEANVKTLVLTHFRKKSAKLMQALIEEVRADFSGNLQIGEDLMVIQLEPTQFADVNNVLESFHAHVQTLLGSHFLGMYAIGSLALGDFDPASSDIDFIVVTDTNLADPLVRGLQDIHERFAASSSPWATKIEAVYVPQAALRTYPPTPGSYPQIEKGESLEQAALEPGWVFQCWTLRERGVVVAGPNPRTLVGPTEPQEMDAAVVVIAGGWIDAAHHDPTWLEWLRHRPHHTFVIQTLCRLLYSLATREVTSKPQALQWAQNNLGLPWSTLIQDAWAPQSDAGQLAQSKVEDTIAFIEYTVKQGQREAN